MKKYLLSLFIAPAFFAGAQTPLPYYTGFDNTAQKAGWVQFRTGYLGNYQWNYGSGYSAPTGLSHDYPVGSSSTDTTIDWFVSPAFDFSGGGSLDSLKIVVYTISGSVQPVDHIGIYLLTGSNNPSIATVSLLANLTGMYSNVFNLWQDTGNFTIPPATGNTYIAIKYRATQNWFTINVDNIYISGSSTGVNEQSDNAQLSIFPQPASGMFTVTGSHIITGICLCNALGEKVKSFKTESSTIQVDATGLQPGIYFLQVQTDEGNTVRKIMIR